MLNKVYGKMINWLMGKWHKNKNNFIGKYYYNGKMAKDMRVNF